MEVKYNGKIYKKINDKWISTNKKGNEYTVIGKNIISDLEEELNRVDLTKDDKEDDLPVSGLGDLISKATHALGIEECDGCKKRKERANRYFNWLKQTRDLTEEENDFVKDLASRKSMSGDESKRLFNLYNEITASKLKRCTCPGLHMRVIERLMRFTY